MQFGMKYPENKTITQDFQEQIFKGTGILDSSLEFPDDHSVIEDNGIVINKNI